MLLIFIQTKIDCVDFYLPYLKLQFYSLQSTPLTLPSPVVKVVSKKWGAPFPSPFPPSPFPSPFLPFPFPPVPLPSLSSSLPLRSRTPLLWLGDLGEHLSSPGGVWGRAPAEIEFGAF